VVILLAFVTIDNVGRFGITRSVLSYTKPVGTVFTDLGSGVSGFFRNIINVGSLQKDNKSLQNKLDVALNEVSKLDSLQKENNQLRNDLNFKKASQYNLIGTKVVYFDPSNITSSVVIGVGTDDGVKLGDIVVASGYLVGRVNVVETKTAKVILITDPESTIAATVVNKNISGTTKGKIGNGLSMDQVPQNEKVIKGDIVSTSGLGGTFPKGLLIGEVENVQQISGSIFQAIDIQPFLDFNTLDNVMVIKRS